MPTCDSQNLSMHHTFHCYVNVLLIKMSGNKVLKKQKYLLLIFMAICLTFCTQQGEENGNLK